MRAICPGSSLTIDAIDALVTMTERREIDEAPPLPRLDGAAVLVLERT